MEDLRKIYSLELYKFWELLAISLATIVAMLAMTYIFPATISPILSLICAGVLYQVIINMRRRHSICIIVPYGIFFSLIIYSFVAIILNILNAWGIIDIYNELIFYKGVYVPSLIYLPIALLTSIYIYARRDKLSICVNCHVVYADTVSRNRIGNIFNRESRFQLRNLIFILALMTTINWSYFLVFYININTNARDWYVFLWLVLLAFVIDEVYFIFRYYNLYLDLKERNEIITPEDIDDMTAKTYLRFYVISGNYIYCDLHARDARVKNKEVIDTPFFTKRNVNGITKAEVRQIIERMTGVDGTLRLFYGRKTDMRGHSIIRYFYFIDGTPEEYPELRTPGEWMDFEEFKLIYSTEPQKLAPMLVLDTTRMSTIILTYKTYDEAGFRRSRISSYHANFNLHDVKDLDLDFQNDNWIKISLFNSDMPMYRMRRWWRKLIGQSV